MKERGSEKNTLSGGPSRLGASRRPRRGGLSGGPSAAYSSRLSGSECTRGHPKGRGRAIRVWVDGQDLTPLSLLDEKTSLAVPAGSMASKGSSVTGESGLFGSSAAISSQFHIGGSGPPPTTAGSLGMASAAQTTLNSALDEAPELSHTVTQVSPQINFNEAQQNQVINEAEMKQEPIPQPTAADRRTGVISSNAEMRQNQIDFEEMVSIYLDETSTQTHLAIRGVCVSVESDQHKEVVKRNGKYENLCEEKAVSDLYMGRAAQNLILDTKNVDASTNAAPVQDSGCQATSWDIFDVMLSRKRRLTDPQEGKKDDDLLALEEEVNSSADEKKNEIIEEEKMVQGIDDREEFGEILAKARSAEINKVIEESIATPGCLLPVDKDSKHLMHVQAEEKARAPADLVLLQTLGVIERGVQQNNFHHRHVQYRAFEDSEIQETDPAAEEEPSKPNLELLWQFKCEETKGRTVSSMSWNRVNQDILAVAYCQFNFEINRDGLIMLWTLKNPDYPERCIACDTGVCSIDFSSKTPSLLAAGFHDGRVAVYDLHLEGDAAFKPILCSDSSQMTHMDAVWEVKWVERNERGEVLISLGSDGRVIEWSFNKGLSGVELMALKRVHVPPELGGVGEGIISRSASGLCMDFPSNDSSIYFAATEDGTVHKCSCSYNEQYLDTYYGHFGPVYRLKCSPFWPDAFLTCSADWSIKLWESESSGSSAPPLHIQSVDLAEVVHDVAWSPTNPLVLAAVAGDGRLEVWDLGKSSLNPLIKYWGFDDDDNQGAQNSSEPPRPSGASNTSVSEESSQSVPEPSRLHKKFFSTVAFAYNAPILVAGDSTGSVHVFRRKCMVEKPFDNIKDARAALQAAIEENHGDRASN